MERNWQKEQPLEVPKTEREANKMEKIQKSLVQEIVRSRSAEESAAYVTDPRDKHAVESTCRIATVASQTTQHYGKAVIKLQMETKTAVTEGERNEVITMKNTAEKLKDTEDMKVNHRSDLIDLTKIISVEKRELYSQVRQLQQQL